MKQKVLIVEDESIIAMEIASYVEGLGYDVLAAVASAQDAYMAAIQKTPDIILMDVHLKGEEDGISAVERIKKEQDVAIIYITAFNDDESMKRAIATDPTVYLSKPFNRKELSAALLIASRRFCAALEAREGMIKFNDEFNYDMQNQQLLCCGEHVHLTRRERELLVLLMKAKGQMVDIYSIENAIWPEKVPNESTRRGLVARLRAKLKYQFIETVSGQGYYLHY